MNLRFKGKGNHSVNELETLVIALKLQLSHTHVGKEVILNNIDLDLLKEQKMMLLYAIDGTESVPMEEALQGILNILDEIQDQLEPLD